MTLENMTPEQLARLLRRRLSPEFRVHTGPEINTAGVLASGRILAVIEVPQKVIIKKEQVDAVQEEKATEARWEKDGQEEDGP